MKKILLCVLGLMSVQAFAADSQSTKIVNASMVCSKHGGMYAFDMTRGKERVWQTDEGSDEGFELNEVEVKTKRCRNCWDVKAILELGGQRMRQDFIIGPSLTGEIKAAVKLSKANGPNAGQVLEKFVLNCKVK